MQDFASYFLSCFANKCNILNNKDFNMCAKYDQLQNIQWGLIVSAVIRSQSTDLSTAIVGEKKSGFPHDSNSLGGGSACMASS
jgi:hypothetical protein